MNSKLNYLCVLLVALLFAPPAHAQSARKEVAHVIVSGSPNKRWGTVFLINISEGSGQYCAMDGTKPSGHPDFITERVPVANVKGVTIKPRISGQRTVWSADGEKACLLVQNRPVAILDFKNQRGYTKTPTRKPIRWKQRAFTWDERLLRSFPTLTNGG